MKSFVGIALILCLLVFREVEGLKTQNCSAASDQVQVTYSNNCTSTCLQRCGDPPGNNASCSNLVSPCGDGAAACGATGCECLPSSRLPGNPYSSANISKNIVYKVTCKWNHMKIILHKCALNAIGYKLKDLFMNGINRSRLMAQNVSLASNGSNTCKGELKIKKDGIFYVFNIVSNLDACNGDVKLNANKDEITFSNAIQALAGNNGPVISRSSSLYINFSCSFPTTINSSSASVTPGKNTVDVNAGNLTGHYTIDLELWVDNWFGTPYAKNQPINVNDYIYVTVDAKNADRDRFTVQVLKAWATPSSSPDDPVFYPLIVQGCRNPNEVLQDGIIIGRNSQPEDARFKFRVFQFVALTQAGAPQQLFVHAMVHLCDQKVEIQCSIACNSRTRREMYEYSDARTTSSQLPIIVVRKRDTQQVDDGGLSNGTDTDSINRVRMLVTELNDSWVLVVMVIIVAVVLLALSLTVCLLAVKRNEAETTEERLFEKK